MITGRAWAWAKQVVVRCGYFTRPSFLIIGAAKSGTTALHAYLSSHPNIHPGWDKEVHFFDQDVSYSRGYAWYHTRFSLPFLLPRQAVTFCATPDYLFVPQCAERIHRYNPDLKLIALLREPAERAYSFWTMLRNYYEKRQGYLILDQSPRFDPPVRHAYRDLFKAQRFPAFEEWIDRELETPSDTLAARQPNLIRYGLYDEQLERFYRLFSPDQMLILEYRHFADSTREVLDQVTDFLGLPRHNWDERIRNKVNGQQYSVELSQTTRERLRSFFRPHNRQLADLLHRDFGW